MSDDKKQDLKKGFSNNFVWLLLAAFLFALMLQNFMESKSANVSFSYQLEHLVNLQLNQPEDNRKTALNDNLVTFSGKFRENLTDEGKNRFKYLELLNENHELKNDQVNVAEDLVKERDKIIQSADWFLLLSGVPVPPEGYTVVDNFYNTTSQNNGVVIRDLPRKSVEGLGAIKEKFTALKANPSEKGAEALGVSLIELINQIRSPLLGIGSEPMKQNLRDYEKEVLRANSTNMALSEKLPIYEQAIKNLQGIFTDLNQLEGHMRLSKLRSVRSYKDTLDRSSTINTKLEDNEAQLDKARMAVSQVIWFFNNQELSTRALEKQDPEVFHHWFIKAKAEWDQFAQNSGASFKAPDQPVNTVLEKTFKSEETAPNYLSYLFTFLPILMIALVLYMVFARQMKGVGSSAMNFGKSPAKLMSKDKNKITFKDVAGVDEAIEELQEIVEFLKNPQKFTSLGGRIPKGVLCVGPPGTGKTLIAKAVAGEADRPFFSISGSDFVEMFVGVGASRIRDMFDQAKKQAPCIIFMDEIDAVGRHRGAGIGGGHDEREQTLNQLLVEMDGFDTNEGVILMAATNRPDVLDKALLRPGRFDRRIIINLPDIKGRFEILKVHARKIKLDPSADLLNLARSTPGSSGADLENILNEAALAAARKGRTAVTEQEVAEARDKVMFGKERRSLELDENEKKTTAYHEAGHTIVGLVVEHGDTVDKVTIIPRGFSLGSTMFLPKKNRVSYWKKEIIDRLAVLMGGRCAEEIFVGDVSSGAQQDIEQATHFARSMVCEWGMSDKLGAVAYDEAGSETSQYLGVGSHHEKKYSEQTAKVIDEEVRRIMDEANARARQIINEHHDHVNLLAQMLIEFETLDKEDIQKILENTWSMEDKRAKLKLQDELHKLKPASPPPPPPKFGEEGSTPKTPYRAEA